MQTFIEIGGQKRAFAVGVNQGSEFCFLQNFTLAQYAATFTNVAAMGFGVQRDFIYSALKAANDLQGKKTEFTNLEVGFWMDAPECDTVELLTPIIAALGAQFAAKKAYQEQREAKNAGALPTGPNPQIADAAQPN